MRTTQSLSLKNGSSCVIPHNDPRKQAWNWLIILLTFWEGFEVPIHISFEEFKLFPYHDMIVSFIFILDIIVHSRTSFFISETGEQVKDPKKILKYYCLSIGFFLDVIAALPFFALSSVIESPLLVWLDLFKLAKLFRL